LVRALQHHTRERIPPNADPERAKNNAISRSTQEALQIYSKALEGQKVRKNAVHALDIYVGFSPEAWKDKPIKERCSIMTGYLETAAKWMALKLGGMKNVAVRAQHWDELTPHAHLVVIPMVEGKLNARALIGGHRDRLKELQTQFWEEVGKKYGLERGLPREQTKRRHVAVKEYYAKVDKVMLQERQREAKLMAEAQERNRKRKGVER
jgi:hypothetical protein